MAIGDESYDWYSPFKRVEIRVMKGAGITLPHGNIIWTLLVQHSHPYLSLIPLVLQMHTSLTSVLTQKDSIATHTSPRKILPHSHGLSPNKHTEEKENQNSEAKRSRETSNQKKGSTDNQS